jgi:hypothetical protein
MLIFKHPKIAYSLELQILDIGFAVVLALIQKVQGCLILTFLHQVSSYFLHFGWIFLVVSPSPDELSIIDMLRGNVLS